MDRPSLERPQASPPPKRAQAVSLEPTAFLPEEDRLVLEHLDRTHREFLDHTAYVLNHSPQTRKTYAIAYADFRRFLLDRRDDRPGTTLTAKVTQLERWVARNRKRGLSPITTNTYWRALRPYYNYLERTEGFANPYRGAKAPGFQRPLPKAHRAVDLHRILDAARSYPWTTAFGRERAVAILSLMIYAGLRRGEVLNLHYADVNLEQGTILIRRGKGRDGGKDRTCYVNPDLRYSLSTYLHERGRMGFTCPEFFVSRENHGLSLNQLKRIHLAVRRASGVDFTLHSLRHSFVTMLLRSGVPINVAQELAGHADITTTAGYLRVWDEDKKAQIQKLQLR